MVEFQKTIDCPNCKTKFDISETIKEMWNVLILQVEETMEKMRKKNNGL